MFLLKRFATEYYSHDLKTFGLISYFLDVALVILFSYSVVNGGGVLLLYFLVFLLFLMFLLLIFFEVLLTFSMIELFALMIITFRSLKQVYSNYHSFSCNSPNFFEVTGKTNEFSTCIYLHCNRVLV